MYYVPMEIYDTTIPYMIVFLNDGSAEEASIYLFISKFVGAL